MNKPLDLHELKKLESVLLKQIDEDKKYWRINEVKCDAIHTANTYEEFSDRVSAAHLRPMEKKDQIKSGSCKTVWNTAVKTRPSTED